MKQRNTLFFAISLTAISLESCTKKQATEEEKSESTTESTPSGITKVTKVETVSLSKIYPTDLAIFSPLLPVKGSDDLDPDTTYIDYKTLIKNDWKKLNSTTVDNCLDDFSDNAETFTSPSCYGPSIEYQGHPDGSPSSGTTLANELAIWSSTESNNEACSAAKLNYEINSHKRTLQIGLNAAKLLICLGNISKVEPLTQNAELDLTQKYTDLLDSKLTTATLKSAAIKRSEEDDKIFHSSNITLTRLDGTSITVNLKHRLLNDDNALYQGKLSVIITPPEESIDRILAASVHYDKSSAEKLLIDFRSSDFPINLETTDIFDSKNTLQLSSDTADYIWGIYSFNPENTVGKYAFLWTDATAQDNVRSMISNIELDGKSELVAYSYSGFGSTLEEIYNSSLHSGWLDRMICNTSGPSANLDGIASVQRQYLKQSSTSGLFLVTSSKIGYVMRNSCGTDDDFQDGFSWRLSGSSSNYNTFISKNDLATISGVAKGDINVPEMPDDL